MKIQAHFIVADDRIFHKKGFCAIILYSCKVGSDLQPSNTYRMHFFASNAKKVMRKGHNITLHKKMGIC